MNKFRYDMNLAKINAKRTLFKIPHNYKTTFNAGDLVPVKCVEVLPGDTWSEKVSAVVRELTLLNPVMDNSYIQFDAFFVPMRIIWNQTKQFFGENETGIWTETNDYEIPNGPANLLTGTSDLSSGSIGDYFGLPVDVGTSFTAEKVNYLPLRAYAMIWNYYYMAETTQAPVLFTKENDIVFNESFGSSLFRGYESPPLKVNRFADLFTSALPQPQKGENVPFLSDYLPIITRDKTIDSEFEDINTLVGLKWGNLNYMPSTGYSLQQYVPDSGNIDVLGVGGPDSAAQGFTAIASNETAETIEKTRLNPINLWASTIDSGLRDINSLRIAIATQHYFEALALGGSRYGERIKTLFNVNTPSEVINIPQYLGSIKKLINVNQVLSTAENTNAVLGTTGAYSHTAIRNEHLYTGSFTEYGYILVLAHIRTDNTYCQGIPKMFSKKTQWDIYNPLFASIGNVPIKNKEVYFSDNDTTNNEVFGYAESWYEYKSMPNIITGYMRPNVENGFSSWTYSRTFSSLPVLNSDFTTQTATEVDRTLAVSSTISNQFKLDIFYDATASRIMPLYSIPGLNKI